MRPLAQRTPGASQADRSTTGRTSGVSLQLDQSHRPSRLAAWRAMPRSEPAAVSRSRPRCHRFTLTRLPEPSVLVPIGTVLNEASWGGPRSFGSEPWPRCPRATCVSRGPGRLAGTPRAIPKDHPNTPQQVPVADGCPSTRSDPTPSQSPAPDADSPSPPVDLRLPRARSEMAGELCPAPSPLCVVSDVGWTSTNRNPLLIAPVRMRCSERCSVKTPQNPRSRGIFKITGLSPKVSRYPQESCRHPPDAHRSCTGKRTVAAAGLHASGRR